jgi:hypothetical protein
MFSLDCRTPWKRGGVEIATSYSAIEKSGMLSREYHEYVHELYKKVLSIPLHEMARALMPEQYHPIEIDVTIPMEEKCRAMEEWWHLANNALVREKVCFSLPPSRTFPPVLSLPQLQYSKVKEMVAAAPTALREVCFFFFLISFLCARTLCVCVCME